MDVEDFKQDNTSSNDNIKDHSYPETWKLDFNQKEINKLKNNPFGLILNDIFGYLSPKDLLNASLVSKNWYNLIGKLDTFNRLKLNFSTNSYYNESDEHINAIKNSSRIYENINITIQNKKKDIQIAEQIVFKYSSYIKCLKLVKFGGNNCMFNEPLNMPCLEELEVQVSCGRLSWKFFQNVTTLRKLIINGIEPKGLEKCLDNNPNLKELSFCENSFISYFNRDISKNIKFQLKSLKILHHSNQLNLLLNGEFRTNTWSQSQRVNFYRLLSTQKSLKALHLDACHAEDLNIIFKVNTLKLLEINKIDGTLNQQISSSLCIQSFMTRTEEMSFESIEKILILLPKLESLYIHQLSVEIFFRLLGHQHLKNFHYFWASEQTYGRLISLKEYYTGSIYVTRSTKDEFINMFS